MNNKNKKHLVPIEVEGKEPTIEEILIETELHGTIMITDGKGNFYLVQKVITKK